MLLFAFRTSFFSFFTGQTDDVPTTQRSTMTDTNSMHKARQPNTAQHIRNNCAVKRTQLWPAAKSQPTFWCTALVLSHRQRAAPPPGPSRRARPSLGTCPSSPSQPCTSACLATPPAFPAHIDTKARRSHARRVSRNKSRQRRI